MDARLIALKALSGKTTLKDEFVLFYESLLKDKTFWTDKESAHAARDLLHDQVEFTMGELLECDDAPGAGYRVG